MTFGIKRFRYDNRDRLVYGDDVFRFNNTLPDLLNTVVDCVRFRVNRKELSEALERFVAQPKDGG